MADFKHKRTVGSHAAYNIFGNAALSCVGAVERCYLSLSLYNCMPELNGTMCQKCLDTKRIDATLDIFAVSLQIPLDIRLCITYKKNHTVIIAMQQSNFTTSSRSTWLCTGESKIPKLIVKKYIKKNIKYIYKKYFFSVL